MNYLHRVVFQLHWLLYRILCLLSDNLKVGYFVGSAVGVTLDEVRRALVKGSTPDADASFTSSDEAGDRRFGSPNNSTAFPQDEDKKLLKDLLDLRNFGISTTKPVSSAVKVQQVYSSKYKDSDSSDDGSVGEVDSPHLSSCSGSAFRKSDSIRSSLQTNCSSVIYGGDAATNKASGSLHDNSSHLLNPYSQQEEPSDLNLIRYADERCSVTSRLSGVSQTEDDEHLADAQSSVVAADCGVAASASAVGGAFHFEPADETDSLKMPCKSSCYFGHSVFSRMLDSIVWSFFLVLVRISHDHFLSELCINYVVVLL